MTVKECYEAMGGDYEDVLGRLMSDKIVHKFVLKFLDDPSMDLLCKSIESGDSGEAFRAAHTLKGVCQNLGLAKLHHSSNDITEVLRGGDIDGAKEKLVAVQADYDVTIKAIQELQAEG